MPESDTTTTADNVDVGSNTNTNNDLEHKTPVSEEKVDRNSDMSVISATKEEIITQEKIEKENEIQIQIQIQEAQALLQNQNKTTDGRESAQKTRPQVQSSTDTTTATATTTITTTHLLVDSATQSDLMVKTRRHFARSLAKNTKKCFCCCIKCLDDSSVACYSALSRLCIVLWESVKALCLSIIYVFLCLAFFGYLMLCIVGFFEFCNWLSSNYTGKKSLA